MGPTGCTAPPRSLPNDATRTRCPATTAARPPPSSRALDEVAGGGFYPIAEEAERDLAIADDVFASTGAGRSTCRRTSSTRRAGTATAPPRSPGSCSMVDAERWRDAVDPHLLDARGVGDARVRRRARPRSRCSRRRPATPTTTCCTNPQIAAARERGRPLRGCGPGAHAHDRASQPRPGRARRDGRARRRALRPSGWKCYTLCGPPTTASPTGGWFLDDDEIGFPFLERVRALGPRRWSRCTRASADRSRRRRWRPRRRATSGRPRPRSPT